MICVLDPPSVEMTPDSEFLQVKLGEEMQISCTASGVPAPIITWRSKVNNLCIKIHITKFKFYGP